MQTESPLWPFGNREIAWHFSNRGCLFDIFHQPLFQAYQDAQVLDTQNCCSLPFIFNGYWFVFRGKKQGIFKKSDFLHSGSHHVDLWAAVLQPSRNTCSCVKNSPWVKVWLTAVCCVRLKLLKKMEKKKSIFYNGEDLRAERLLKQNACLMGESALHLTVAVLPSAGGN